MMEPQSTSSEIADVYITLGPTYVRVTDPIWVKVFGHMLRLHGGVQLLTVMPEGDPQPCTVRDRFLPAGLQIAVPSNTLGDCMRSSEDAPVMAAPLATSSHGVSVQKLQQWWQNRATKLGISFEPANA